MGLKHLLILWSLHQPGLQLDVSSHETRLCPEILSPSRISWLIVPERAACFLLHLLIWKWAGLSGCGTCINAREAAPLRPTISQAGNNLQLKCFLLLQFCTDFQVQEGCASPTQILLYIRDIFGFSFSSIHADSGLPPQLFPSLHRWDGTGMTVLSPPWLPHPSPPSSSSSSLHFPFAHHHQCKPGENCDLPRSDTGSVLLYGSVPIKHVYIHIDSRVKQEVEKKCSRMQGSICSTSCCAVTLGSQTHRLTKTTGLKAPLQTDHEQNLTERSINLHHKWPINVKMKKIY